MENQTFSPIEKQQAIWDAEPPTKEELKALRLYMENIEVFAFIKKFYPSLLN